MKQEGSHLVFVVMANESLSLLSSDFSVILRGSS